MTIFKPIAVKRIFTVSIEVFEMFLLLIFFLSKADALQFRHSDNIVYFLNGCRLLGLPPIFYFELVDLYEKKNIPKVIYCVHALSHLIEKKGISHIKIKNLQGKITFEDSEIKRKERELVESGVSIPAFNQVSQMIVDHLEKEVATPSYTQDEINAVMLMQSCAKKTLAAIELYLVGNYAEFIQSIWKTFFHAFDFLQVHDGASIINAFVKSFIERSFWLQSNSAVIIQSYSKACFDRYTFFLQHHASSLVQDYWMSYRCRSLLKNVVSAKRIQTIFKGAFFSKSFKRISREHDSITLRDVCKFLTLFDCYGSSLQKEIELESLRSSINRKINECQQKEEMASDLDVKVGLLLKNTLSLEDLIKCNHGHVSKSKDHRSSSVVPATGHGIAGSNSAVSMGSNNISTNDASEHSFGAESAVAKNLLLGLDRENHTKLKQYRQLLYLLQTDPKYLVEIVLQMTSNKAKSFIDDCVIPLFGHGQSSREEFLLLRFIEALCESELSAFSNSSNEDDILTADLLFMRIVLGYARGAKEVSYLKRILSGLIGEVVGNDEIVFETDPLQIYREFIKREEFETGVKSSLPYDVTREEAFQHQLVKDRYVANLKSLGFFCKKALHCIVSSVNALPYSIRYIAKKLFSTTGDIKHLSHFIYYRYINPAIVAPEAFDVLERPISAEDRKNLAEISRVLQYVVVGKSFNFADYPYLVPMNEFINQANSLFLDFLDEIQGVPSLREHYEIPDGIIVESDYVYLTLHQLYRIHDSCFLSLSLKDICSTLGSAPEAFKDLLTSIRIDLMKPRNLTVYNVDGYSSLLLHIKKFLLQILKATNEASRFETIIELLNAPTSEFEETAYANILSGANELFDENSTINSDSFKNDMLGDYEHEEDFIRSLASLKKMVCADIPKLEGYEGISQARQYAAIFASFARDLQVKLSKDKYTGKELEIAHRTLAHLNEKAHHLDVQIVAIQDYLKSAIQVLSLNAKAKKPVLFSRHYAHIKKLEKDGKVSRFGSYKYTAAELFSRGILLGVAEYTVSQYEKISISISSNDAGVFNFEATLLGVKIPQTATLKLEELLDLQFNNVQKIALFGGLAKVNVNLLLHFLNKKFFE